MAQIPFTRPELNRAWKSLYAASKQVPRGNAHRLLLLYAIECGLKALWIRHENRTLYNGKEAHGNPIGGANGHDLREIMKQLRFGKILTASFDLNDVRDDHKKTVIRKNNPIDALHQVWRYGGALAAPPVDDATIEHELERAHLLIEKELKS